MINKLTTVMGVFLVAGVMSAGCESGGGDDSGNSLALLALVSGVAGGSGSASDSATANHLCRTYDTRAVGSDSSVRVSSFDSTALTLTTTNTKGASTWGDTKTYNSVADFVNETAVIPTLMKFTKIVHLGGSTSTYDYDSAGRPTTGYLNGTLAEEFTSWDSVGRATTRVYKTLCSGVEVTATQTHDDSTRTFGLDANDGCLNYVFKSEFDANGSVISFKVDNNRDGDYVDAGESNITYTVDTTATVCK